MNIKWFGQACFQIEADNTIIITDPFSSMPGIKLPKNLTADIVTISHNHADHNNIKAVSGNPKVLDILGESEIAGVKIKTVESFHDNVNGKKRGKNIVFVFEIESLRVCHLGDLGHILTKEQLKAIGLVDILMIPVGGFFTIEPKEAVEVVKQTRPKIILPMHYKTNPLVPIPIQRVKPFLDAMKLEVKETPELSINKQELNTWSQIIVVIKTATI